MIGIINYGMGNIGSIQNMLRKIGALSKIIDAPEDIESVSKLILPGVGSFDHGMENLSKKGWVEPLSDAVLRRRIPVLGICLGMQLMTNGSEEGTLAGLGWIKAHTEKFSFPVRSTYKIPHMGWNIVKYSQQSILFKDLGEEPRFYFVHSYHVICEDFADIAAKTPYGKDIVCSFEHDNIMGVQFHPEKSHKFGITLLRNFANS